MFFIVRSTKLLIDLSAFSHVLKEDHSTYKSDVKILDELTVAFSPGGPCAAITFPQLEVLATRLFKRWMTNQAHELAIFPASRTGWEDTFGRDGGPFKNTSKTHMTDVRPQISDPPEDVNMSGSGGGDDCDPGIDQNPDEAGWDPLHSLATAGDQVEGDHTLANSILLMRDAAIYLELNDAIHDGDTGRVMEVVKVSVNV